MLNEIEVKGPTEQTGNGSRIKVLPLRTMNKGQGYYCLDSVITTEDMTAVYRKARSLNASVNDVFMTAWARVLGQYQQTDQVMLSCPADLRRFWPGPDRDRMTVANMTGIYGQVVVEHVREYSFDQLLSQVTIEMKLQKERSRCFTGIKLLNTLFRYLPKPLLKAAIRLSYPLQPVTYTNIGVVDDQKLFFQNCNISQCCLTGTYRQAPEFQLAISSFKNTCTLSSSLVGEEDELESCRSVLEQVKEEILVWVHDQPEIR